MGRKEEKVIRTAFYTASPYQGALKPDGKSRYQYWKVIFKADFRKLHRKVPSEINRAKRNDALDAANKFVNDVAKFGTKIVEFDRDELYTTAVQAANSGQNPITLLKLAIEYNLGSNPEFLEKSLSTFWPHFREKSSQNWNKERVVSQWDSFYSRNPEFFSSKAGEFIEVKGGREILENLLRKVASDCQGDPARRTLKGYLQRATQFLVWLAQTGEIPQISAEKIRQASDNVRFPKCRDKREYNPVVTPEQDFS